MSPLDFLRSRGELLRTIAAKDAEIARLRASRERDHAMCAQAMLAASAENAQLRAEVERLRTLTASTALAGGVRHVGRA